ncbi:MAG: class II fumarate hydratase [Lactobacillales bacterium]|nr:class II fumarate hydratase [Lactobacillales bacterium]
MEYRIERDSMGEVEVPKDALWSAQTERSRNNFKIGGQKMPLELVLALVTTKKAMAFANNKVGKLDDEKFAAIDKATDEILAGAHNDAFPLVVWQTGSGTQSNMNANEVIANLAGVHPNDHVNMSQSSNDVFPTAMHVATAVATVGKLLPQIDATIDTLQQLENRYQNLVKIGRTHLQDATPVTFGQEVSAWKASLSAAKNMITSSMVGILELALGGTAVGTGLNTTDEITEIAVAYISELTGLPFTSDPNKFHALSTKDALSFYHGALRTLAANALKMANDIRHLASGPRSGLGELTIPSNEPGSSIMPGKINPTQCEALSMVVARVFGNDTTIAFAASQGNFELNVYMPVMIFSVLESVNLLADALESFRENCLNSLTANEDKMKELLEQSLMLVTALNPHIGYDKGAKIAKTAFEKNQTLKETAIELGYLTAEEYDEWVRPEKMV